MSGVGRQERAESVRRTFALLGGVWVAAMEMVIREKWGQWLKNRE